MRETRTALTHPAHSEPAYGQYSGEQLWSSRAAIDAAMPIEQLATGACVPRGRHFGVRLTQTRLSPPPRRAHSLSMSLDAFVYDPIYTPGAHADRVARLGQGPRGLPISPRSGVLGATRSFFVTL